MLLKLIVTHSTRTDYNAEYLFDKPSISVGRLQDNEVVLPDQELIVGRRHFEIRSEGNFAWIIDDGSKNFTYLNGERLVHSRQYQLRDGDIIQAGKYEIGVQIVLPDPIDPPSNERDADATQAQPAYNPFLEFTKLIGDALQQIKAKYIQTEPGFRDEALRQAIKQEIGHFKEEEIGRLLGEVLAPPAAPAPKEEKPQLKVPNPVAPPPPDPSAPPAFVPFSNLPLDQASAWEQAIGAVYDTRQDAAILKRMSLVDDAMLRIVEKLIKIPVHFKLEFLGHSFIPHSGGFPFHTANAEQLKAFLYDINISPDALRQRLVALDQVADDVLVHEIAMLEGYKQAVMGGIQKILDQLNPEYIKQLAEKEGQDLYTVGMFSHAKWLKFVQQAHFELVREDKGIMEKTVFRPSFVKAYLAKIESGKVIR